MRGVGVSRVKRFKRSSGIDSYGTNYVDRGSREFSTFRGSTWDPRTSLIGFKIVCNIVVVGSYRQVKEWEELVWMPLLLRFELMSSTTSSILIQTNKAETLTKTLTGKGKIRAEKNYHRTEYDNVQ